MGEIDDEADPKKTPDQSEPGVRLPGIESTFQEMLSRTYGDESDPRVDLRGESAEGVVSARLRRMATDSGHHQRYTLRGEIGRGGMGAILRIFDADLRRNLAMKVVLGQGGGEEPGVEAGKVLRFIEEAQVTGQLDHPGIVPVHELGVDADGRVYFTMRLVRGMELTRVFDQVQAGDPEWSQMRALDVLLRVCEAMSYAHEKGVVHRDLKPANIMVGRHGAVYVMDWGCSRIDGRKDSHDIRPLMQETQLSALLTDRQDAGAEQLDSPVLTMDGSVLGTPCYMPPEQAAGRLEELGPHSDVYALGAMLYQLLTGHVPYLTQGDRLSPYMVLAMVVQGPPTPILELAPKASPELVAICEKAMAHDATDRYRNMGEVKSDLRAYLEDRVVQAYRSGPLAELQKWVVRNRFAAISLMSAIALAIVGLSAVYAVSASKNSQLDTKNSELETSRDLADQRATEARHARDDAELEAQRAGAMKSFLEGLFVAADPSQAQQGSLSMRDVLATAFDRLEEQLANQPEARRDLHLNLQSLCRTLYLWSSAEKHLEAALAIDHDKHPEGSAIAARCHWGLGEIFVEAGYTGDMTTEEAVDHFEKALQLYQEFVGEDAPEKVSILTNLAYLKATSENPFQEEMIEALAIIEGETDLEAVERRLMETLRRIEVHWEDGNEEAAFELVRAAIKTALSLPFVGGNVPYGLTRASNILVKVGRFNVAEPLSRESLRLELEKHDGEELIGSVKRRKQLANLLAEAGKTSQAHELHLQNFAIARHVVNDEHNILLEILDNLFETGSKLELWKDVEEHLRIKLGIVTDVYGAQDPQTIAAQEKLDVFLLERTTEETERK